MAYSPTANSSGLKCARTLRTLTRCDMNPEHYSMLIQWDEDDNIEEEDEQDCRSQAKGNVNIEDPAP
jgi:hypothetical protein